MNQKINIQADFFQFVRHVWPTIAAQTETGLFFDIG